MKQQNTLQPDAVLQQIADYVVGHKFKRETIYRMARYCILDALACAFYAMPTPECAKLLGPIARGTRVPNGARVPGTAYVLDPVKAAFDIGNTIRWLDYNDSWYAADGGHPSESLGAVFAVADYMSRTNGRKGGMSVEDVMVALAKLYEIQGVLAIGNSYIKVGLDYVGMVNVASAAIATHLMGGSRDQIINALSNAWLDGPGPRLYRIEQYMGWRKSWASGDASSRGVMHAWMAVRGEQGYPTALSAPQWGFCDTVLRGTPIVIARPLGSYVLENIIFKAGFPSQIHLQTMGECAQRLHPEVKHRIADIKAVHIRTHFRAIESASKEGPLDNAATRDHCLQYVVAFMLLKGKIEFSDYEDEAASDPRIDELRARTVVTSDDEFTRDFWNLETRTNSSVVRVEFNDGTSTREVRIDYPLGHPKRRKEGMKAIEQKFRHSIASAFTPARQRRIVAACSDLGHLRAMPFAKFMDLFAL